MSIRKNFILTLALIINASMGFSLSDNELDAEFRNLTTRSSSDRQDVSKEFIELGNKSTKRFFKVQCLYSAAESLESAGDKKSAMEKYAEVIEISGKPNTDTAEDFVIYEYCAKAHQRLYRLTEDSKSKEAHMKNLLSGFPKSDSAALFVSDINLELNSNRITFNQWVDTVTSTVLYLDEVPGRVISDINTTLLIANRSKGVSDKTIYEILETKIYPVLAAKGPHKPVPLSLGKPDSQTVNSFENLTKFKDSLKSKIESQANAGNTGEQLIMRPINSVLITN